MYTNSFGQELAAKEKMDEIKQFASQKQLQAEARQARSLQAQNKHQSLWLLFPAAITIAFALF